MKLVTISYQPFPRLKFSRTIAGNFPQTFEELAPKQLIAVACLVKGAISEIAFLQAMTGIKKHILKKLDDYQRFNLMELFTIFNDTQPFHEFILKEIGAVKVFHSPLPKFKGVSFGQFIFADTHFSNYLEQNQPEELHRFVASFYLPADTGFTEKQMDDNLQWIAKIEPATLEAIAINYHLLREWLTQVYPLVFVKEEAVTLSEVEGQPATSHPERSRRAKPVTSSSSNGWIKIFESLVGDDIVNHDNYANLPVHNVLRYMSKRIKDNMKRK